MGQSLSSVAIAAVAVVALYFGFRYVKKTKLQHDMPSPRTGDPVFAPSSQPQPSPRTGDPVFAPPSAQPQPQPTTSVNSGGTGNMFQIDPNSSDPCDQVNLGFDELKTSFQGAYNRLKQHCGAVNKDTCKFYKDYPALGSWAVKGNIISNSCNHVL